MNDIDFYTTVAQICSTALRMEEVSKNFSNAANVLSVWQESLKRLEASRSNASEPPNAPAANGP